MRVVVATTALALSVLSVRAQESGKGARERADSARLAELERRVDALTRELERVELGADVVQAETPAMGLGPAAAKVYHVDRGVSIAGYGEVLYENFARELEDGRPASSADRFDALRAILYVGYKFSDRLLFNSEIEVEHANEIALEFAYVDYKVSDAVGARGGLLLVPMGLINELHEPPVFLGTERPVTESRIIPTTWRENGIGLFGEARGLSWRAYLMNSFDGTGFSAAGLRGGRQHGAKARAEDLAAVGRLDWVGTPGLLAGGSAFYGHTGQGRTSDRGRVDGALFLWDLHLDYRHRGLDVRALVAGAEVRDPASLNELSGLTGADAVGKTMLGWYVQGGYDVLRGVATAHQLIPYVRYEEVDTQRRVAAGFSADPANDLTVVSIGVAWKPVPQVAAKLDYQFHSNRANTGVNQWNAQLGWLF